jgi:hypothetical protein
LTLQAHTVFNEILKTSLLPINDLLTRIEIGIIHLIQTHPQPTLISFALMFEHDGVSYVRAIEANRGALCAREVFQGADIFDNLLDKTTTGALACSSKNSTIRSGAIQGIQRDFAQLLLMQPRLKGFFAFIQKSASLKLGFTSKGVPLDESTMCREGCYSQDQLSPLRTLFTHSSPDLAIKSAYPFQSRHDLGFRFCLV